MKPSTLVPIKTDAVIFTPHRDCLTINEKGVATDVRKFKTPPSRIEDGAPRFVPSFSRGQPCGNFAHASTDLHRDLNRM
jgi:hypothetical protein